MSRGTAVQLKGRKRCFDRGEQLWIACASSSLPVPVSPVTSTVMALAATRRVIFSSSSIDSETATKPSCCSGSGSGQIADFSLSDTAAWCSAEPFAMSRCSASSVVRALCWFDGRTTTDTSRSRSWPSGRTTPSGDARRNAGSASSEPVQPSTSIDSPFRVTSTLAAAASLAASKSSSS